MSNVKQNYAYSLAYGLLIMMLPFITTPYISRVLGAEGVGVYSYTHSIASYFVLIIMLGINNYGNRSVALVRDNKEELSKTFWSIYGLQCITSVLVLIFYILFINVGLSENNIIATIQMIYLIAAALDINWFFFGMEKFKLTVTRNIIIKILSVCSIFIFVKTTNDLWLYAIIMTLGTLVSNVILWKFINVYVGFVRPSFRDIMKHIKPNLILFIPVLAVSVYRIMDKIMLGALSTMDQVGYFENADKVINIPMSLITALGTVMLPQMSNLVARGDSERSKKYIDNSMQFVMFTSSAFVFGLAGIAPIFAPIFFGQEFIISGQLIVYLAPTILFISWANVIRTQYLIPNSKDIVFITSVLLGAIVNIVVNLVLIEAYGAIGVAIGTVVAELAVAAYQTIATRKVLDIVLYMKKGYFFLFAGSIMFIVVRLLGSWLEQNIITLLLQIALGGIVYMFLCIIFIYKTQLVVLKKILKIKEIF